ncbi:MAG: hypothetical protein EU517_01325 [Promethearchaeota archaeon]|nr:MAG: hypothetical protein EU517_01325 [Candidatus Lokiarchaeota archaeon]
MERVEENFGDQLRRMNFVFKNQSITTECIKDYPAQALLGETYGPFEKGKLYKLKFFIARPFIRSNYLKVLDEIKCDNIDVQRFAINERDDQSLTYRENKYFLNKVKEFKAFIEREVSNNIKPKIELDRYKSYYTNIIDSRLIKLLRLAKVEISMNDEQKLTESEKILFQYVSRIIKIWRAFFLNN